MFPSTFVTSSEPRCTFRSHSPIPETADDCDSEYGAPCTPPRSRPRLVGVDVAATDRGIVVLSWLLWLSVVGGLVFAIYTRVEATPEAVCVSVEVTEHDRLPVLGVVRRWSALIVGFNLGTGVLVLFVRNGRAIGLLTQSEALTRWALLLFGAAGLTYLSLLHVHDTHDARTVFIDVCTNPLRLKPRDAMVATVYGMLLVAMICGAVFFLCRQVGPFSRELAQWLWVRLSRDRRAYGA